MKCPHNEINFVQRINKAKTDIWMNSYIKTLEYIRVIFSMNFREALRTYCAVDSVFNHSKRDAIDGGFRKLINISIDKNKLRDKITELK